MLKIILTSATILINVTAVQAYDLYDANREYNDMHLQNLERANEADLYRLEQRQQELNRMQYEQEQRIQNMEHEMEWRERSLRDRYGN